MAAIPPEPEGPGRRGRIAAAAGAALTVVIAAIDLALGPQHVLIMGVLVGPIVAVLHAGPRPVGAIGVFALALGVLSGLWNDDFASEEHLIRLVVIAVGAGAATVAARAREGERTALAAMERLAHDNADLSSELMTAERQRIAALENLAEAVTVQAADGSVVFANAAAARLVGYPTPRDVVNTPGTEIAAGFDMFHEDGRPVAMEELPGRRVLAGEDPEPLVLRVRDRRTGEEGWRVVKASAVRDDAGAVRYAINVMEDITETKRNEIAQRLLAEASRVLSASLDIDETLGAVAATIVPAVADWGLVHVPGEHGAIRLVGVAHVDPAKMRFARESWDRHPRRLDEPGPLADILKGGDSLLVPTITDEMLVATARDSDHLRVLREAGMRSSIIVPMRAGGQTLGAITLVSAESGRVYGPAEVAIVEELARRAAVAVANARLYHERSAVAEALQIDLLPALLPDMPGWTTSTLYRPAGEGAEVGGDFLDAFAVGDGWLVVVGDVAGRGPAAASLTAMARYTLRTAATLTGDPAKAVRLLNRALVERRRLALVSLCVAHIRGGARSGSIGIICAGHPAPLTLGESSVTPVAAAGPLLGAIDDGEWGVTELLLEPGDQLVMFTDGVTDARGESERFGDERLRGVLEGARGPEDSVERVRAALASFEAAGRRDDVAMLALQRVLVFGEEGGLGAPALGTGEHHRARLPRGTGAAGAARRAVGAWVAGAVAERRMQELRLLVSEVVTNGIRHSTRRDGEAVEIEVAVLSDRVRVEVRDPGHGFDPQPPQVPPPDAIGGRGLLIVDRIATRWGVEPGDRTCVWFELPRA